MHGRRKGLLKRNSRGGALNITICAAFSELALYICICITKGVAIKLIF